MKNHPFLVLFLTIIVLVVSSSVATSYYVTRRFGENNVLVARTSLSLQYDFCTETIVAQRAENKDILALLDAIKIQHKFLARFPQYNKDLLAANKVAFGTIKESPLPKCYKPQGYRKSPQKNRP